ncbi:MAG: beta-galactosidase GalA [Rhizomicrobium sp.]|jgi:beta-galactosidase
MSGLTRRGILKGSVAAVAASATSIDAGTTPPLSAAVSSSDRLRERLLLDFGWKFHFGHAGDPIKDFGFGQNLNTFAKAGANVATAARPEFDDSDWQAISLPHDWAVELPYVASTHPPGDGDDPRAAHGFKPVGRDFPETSIGWYRKSFDLPQEDLGRRLSLEFDGVFRNAIVLLNGYVVARNESGYCPFQVDVSDFLDYGGKNQLALRVDASLGEGWFYEGAGIYRHVWLVKTDPLHIPPWGTVVRSTLDGARAIVAVETTVKNDALESAGGVRVAWTIIGPDGADGKNLTAPAATLGARESHTFRATAVLNNPSPWSVDSPQLYRAVADVYAEHSHVDRSDATFGIRSIRFDPQRGFFLNDRPLKLKGTCNHQDHAGVGTALPDRLHAWRIEQLKEMGSNAYRTAHNPPAPELLDACDRLGMLVIDETRMMSSDDEGLSQLSSMILRDRNHPSVILWSIGNEEPQQGTARGARIAATMKQLARDLDPTRPITAAMDRDWGDGITPVLDVVGFNYRTEKIDAFHAHFPRTPVLGTETGSTVCTRDEYVRDDAKGFVPAYDTDFPYWASTAEAWWRIVAPRPFIAGGFVWTGFDYRGEPTPFNRWPNVGSQFGIMDACGFPKDNWFYYRAWWNDAPLLHLFPHWNWPGREGESIDVWCHSNLDAVELFLNGASLGVRNVPRFGHVAWKVAYVPGVIEARGVKKGRRILTASRETSGPAAAIQLRPDRRTIHADGEDVAVIAAEVVDVTGRTVPIADNQITFAVSGPGQLIGVGNGDPTSHEADKASARRAFNGRCMAIVQAQKAPGEIRLCASAAGIASATVVIKAAPARIRPTVG